ncbi:MAG TPA: choice-of-anchor tandem repeat GloVer-containing protein [Rhizomicrobium sp.]|jgi:uncharacterized repeat protein (TIGR03803 family)
MRRELMGASVAVIIGMFGGMQPLSASTFTVIHNFTSQNNDGEESEQAPVVTSSGAIIGSTKYGGQYGYGTIYMFTPPAKKKGNWTGGVVYSFGSVSSGGQYPLGSLLLAADGSLYGASELGGAHSQGTIFQITQSGGVWTEHTLFDFDATTPGGWAPQAGVYMDSSGALYGTASAGGTTNDGVVYQLTSGSPRWTETVIHTFTSNGTDGISPSYGALVGGPKGVLYGTTQEGGAFNGGVAYQLAPPKKGGTAWTETILHAFGATVDGELLEGGLVVGANHVLYGTTDGTNNGAYNGTIFSLTPPPKGQTAWTESVLYDFASGGPYGSYPRATVLDKKGNLFCLTNSGGANALGTVFELTAAGTPTDVYDFTTNANKVLGTVSAGKSGAYIGTTYDSTGGYGVVFSIKP